ncbi:hypothetical protein EV421DRAFT_329301 [Armillaria borealis]|uniref:Uncharacterized protein n=1 Tax=Armillaria borealis TaxID=47425 RepID=A0AA39JNH3_9AGAR|nr:hypothetical protein EV421DRAFT_329301 [Armillaria borealis]
MGSATTKHNLYRLSMTFVLQVDRRHSGHLNDYPLGSVYKDARRLKLWRQETGPIFVNHYLFPRSVLAPVSPVFGPRHIRQFPIVSEGIFLTRNSLLIGAQLSRHCVWHQPHTSEHHLCPRTFSLSATEGPNTVVVACADGLRRFHFDEVFAHESARRRRLRVFQSLSLPYSIVSPYRPCAIPTNASHYRPKPFFGAFTVSSSNYITMLKLTPNLSTAFFSPLPNWF